MMTTGAALYKFFASFGIPAYEENSVPDDAKLPYITYEPVDSDWQDPVSISASVWYRDTSYKALFQKVSEIKQRIGGGYSIPVEGGVVYIYKDNPFAQVQATDDDNVKTVYLLLQAYAFCN